MNILFVCTGNTCRSPMAEALLRSINRDPTLQVRSAGLAAAEGLPASEHAIEAMAQRGIDLTGHRAHSVTDEDLAWADVIYGMSVQHLYTILMQAPEYKDKLRILGDGVSDPYGRDLAVYQACADQLTQYIKEICHENQNRNDA